MKRKQRMNYKTNPYTHEYSHHSTRDRVMSHFFQKIPGWFDIHYQDFYKSMIIYLPTNSHIVEVGAWLGCSTSYLSVEIINSKKNIKLDVIDTWNGTKDSDDEDLHNQEASKLDKPIYEQFLENLKPVEGLLDINYKRGYSLDYVNDYKDNSLSLVFLDADHKYESISKDIDAWLPKVKRGGVIAGHDYHSSWEGVARAVNERFKPTILGSVWYKII